MASGLPALGTMSDKRRAPPNLPVELWRHIFRRATEYRDEFDMAVRAPIDAMREMGSMSRDDLLPTKVSLTLVSSLWRRIALEFLFEFLVINLDALPRKMKRYDMIHAHHGSHCPLQHVRHFRMYARPRFYEPPSAEHMDHLVRVFEKCPQLVVYQHYALGRTPAALIAALLSICGDSLRHLSIESSNILPPNFFQLLSDMASNLEYLAIDGRESQFGPATAAMPALHTLSILLDPDVPFSIHWVLPRIKHLEVWYQDDDDTLMAFLERFPKHITILDCKACVVHSVEEILTCFPMLCEVFLPSAPTTSWDIATGTFANLHHVGLYVDDAFGSDLLGMLRHLHTAFDHLTNRDMFPALSHIWLQDFSPIWTHPDQIRWWREWVERVEGFGIKLSGQHEQQQGGENEYSDSRP